MKTILRLTVLGTFGLAFCGLGWLLFRRPAISGRDGSSIVLSVKRLGIGLSPQGLATGQALENFERQFPDIELRDWQSFRMPGDLDVASELMSFAARSAPDVTQTYVHRLQFFIDQGFLRRLNEFIGEDENHDGVLDDTEVRWKPWLRIPPLFRQMGMRGADIYALPHGEWFSVMVYRPELLTAAGLDPGNFPSDFPAFFRAGQKICAASWRDPGGRRIYAMPRNLEGFFQMLLWSAGGSPGVADLIDRQGRLIGQAKPEDNLGERMRALGLKPGDTQVRWRAVFDDEATRQALEAIWKLCWQPWILNPHTGEPLDLTEAEVKSGRARCPVTGQDIILAAVPGGIQQGICAPPGSLLPGMGSDIDALRNGEIAIMPMQNDGVAHLGRDMGKYGFALPPALHPGGTPAVIAIPALYGINAGLSERKLSAAWDFLAFQCGGERDRIAVRYLLDHGYPESVSPLQAERFGFTGDLKTMPPQWVKVNRQAMNVARVIPYFSGYQQAETEFFNRSVRAIANSSSLDIPAALQRIQDDVENRILETRSRALGPWPTFFAALLLIGSVGAVGWGIVAVVNLRGGQARPGVIRTASRYSVIVFWFLIMPAVASVALWSYYPMIRGFLLAFQDYRLSGDSQWVGLANFIEGAGSPRFWLTLWNSVKFIALNVGLGFVAPVTLAILLHEIPRGRYLFRTAFFLPAVTSSLVIMLLWMVLYEPSPEGALNILVKPLTMAWNALAPPEFDLEWPVRWLQNPSLAMLSVVVPAVWAGMGAGCLVYLAALQSVSPDLYEAAEIDGAGFWRKLFSITLPYLRPLLIINLIGVFIGSAQGWNNIFVMTGGGPELATQVAALEIWTNSFVFLRFGLATAQAWVLGALLIGFTVWQIRQMQKLDFRKAQAA